MNKNIILLITIPLISLLTSCNLSKKQTNFETQVLNEVFKELTDSLIYYPAYPPPPPPPEYDSSGTIQINTRSLDRYRKLISQIDTIRKVIAISDSMKIDLDFKDNLDSFYEYFDTIDLKSAVISLRENKLVGRPVEIKHITNTGKYVVILLSSLNSIQSNDNIHKYNFIYYGNMTISRIYFNNTKTKGFFTCEVLCGSQCNYSFLIIVKSHLNKWTIHKMRLLSIV